MDPQSNKAFIIDYFNALSGVKKTRPLIERYVTDKALIEHIEFFDSILPAYEIFADEMIAEGNKVMVKARAKGRHEGEFKGIPPTFKNIEIIAAIVYEIENDKIINHWLMSDQLALLEQMGVANAVA
jgi:predicted ester cyclase